MFAVLRSQPREAFVAYATSWTIVAVAGLQSVTQALFNPDPALHPLQRGTGTVLVVAMVLVFVAWQLHVGSGRLERTSRRARGGAIALLVAGLAVPAVSEAWPVTLLGVAAVLACWPGRWGVLVNLAAAAVFVALVLLDGNPVTTSGYIVLIDLLGAVVLYALTRLAGVLGELRAAREHLARLRVDEERERISRDLHDIMGRTLVTVSLRNQTALRLLDTDPDAARGHLDQLHETVAEGQAQLRALTSGPVTSGVEDEIAAAESLCRRLGAHCSVEVEPVDDPGVAGFVATAVREAVTNMLKHSRPANCWIVVRHETSGTVVSVTNDGVPPTARATGGTGLRALAARAEGLGGALEADRTDGGRFRVLARLPRDVDLEDRPRGLEVRARGVDA